MRTNVAASATTLNAEGTVVKSLTPEQELRRTVMACLLWEDSFYESGEDIGTRLIGLVKKVGFDKTAAMAIEAREQMKLRHVPLLLARELARMSAGRKMGDLLKRIIQRPDELTEFLAIYWKDGRQKVAKQVQYGLARAFRKFSEHELAKYDRDHAVKLRDALFLAHAKPQDANSKFTKVERKAGVLPPTPGALFYAKIADRRLATPDTWEVSLSAGADKGETFTRLINAGKLGALAMLRNLRNMVEAKVDPKVIRKGLTEMKVERVLPFRFIAAAKYAPAYEPELEAAMFRCVEGMPKLAGKTALIVDTSPSMWMARVSEKSEMDRFEAAAAMAILCREVCEDVAVYAFNEKGYAVAPRRGFALRDALYNTRGNASCGGLAVDMANKDGYDRIIVLTDGQWHYSDLSTGRMAGYGMSEGNAIVVSPKPLTDKAYMINCSIQKNGVGYGRWVSIDGFSEAILQYISAYEAIPRVLA